MHEHSHDDLGLSSLECRLAAAAPRLPAAEQQQLLYRCAFAAGERAEQHAGRRRLRRWQAAAVISAGFLVALGIASVKPQPDRVADQPPAAPISPQPLQPQPPQAEEIPLLTRRPAPIRLDAWQIEPREDVLLAEELDRFAQTDPHLQALTVARLTRAFNQP